MEKKAREGGMAEWGRRRDEKKFLLNLGGLLWVVLRDQFRYIKVQPKTIDLSARLWGINTEFVAFIPQSLVLKSIVLG